MMGRGRGRSPGRVLTPHPPRWARLRHRLHLQMRLPLVPPQPLLVVVAPPQRGRETPMAVRRVGGQVITAAVATAVVVVWQWW